MKSLKEHFVPFTALAAATSGGVAASLASYTTGNKIVIGLAGALTAGLAAFITRAAQKLVDHFSNRMDGFFKDFEDVQEAINGINIILGQLTSVVDHRERFEEKVDKELMEIRELLGSHGANIAVLMERTRIKNA